MFIKLLVHLYSFPFIWLEQNRNSECWLPHVDDTEKSSDTKKSRHKCGWLNLSAVKIQGRCLFSVVRILNKMLVWSEGFIRLMFSWRRVWNYKRSLKCLNTVFSERAMHGFHLILFFSDLWCREKDEGRHCGLSCVLSPFFFFCLCFLLFFFLFLLCFLK